MCQNLDLQFFLIYCLFMLVFLSFFFYSPFFAFSVFQFFSCFFHLFLFCFVLLLLLSFLLYPFFFTFVFVSVFQLLWVSSLAYPNLRIKRLGGCCFGDPCILKVQFPIVRKMLNVILNDYSCLLKQLNA
jgi:hypothetical protein